MINDTLYFTASRGYKYFTDFTAFFGSMRPTEREHIMLFMGI